MKKLDTPIKAAIELEENEYVIDELAARLIEIKSEDIALTSLLKL